MQTTFYIATHHGPPLSLNSGTIYRIVYEIKQVYKHALVNPTRKVTKVTENHNMI